MTKKKLRLSIVIPVYNEENHLPACLEAIANQTVPVEEVIVVDNNSTDDTAKIAASYPFVKLVNEPKQGVVYARDHGFDVASGEIIGRIDADTIVPDDWATTISEIFRNNDLDAVSGAITYYEMALSRALDEIDAYFRRRVANKLGNDVFLYGANMAIRSSAWRLVRNRVCHKNGMHEDFDLAIHLEEIGAMVTYDERLTAAVSTRRAEASFMEFYSYTRVSPDTYAQHDIPARKHMYPVVALAVAGHLPLKLLRRGYDPDTGGFSLAKALNAPKAMRPDPTTNVV